ncbi:hypothetical protein CFP56_036032 [Quercus suber]|uniref:Uncharacterized protein n=1 Tax=Quercus suber TaxID=58331 RepID=A0AAW0J8V0_QUESU
MLSILDMVSVRFLAQRQLIIPNENFDVHQKKDNIDGKVNGLKKTATKKGNRKDLNDITKQIIKHSYRNEKERTKKKEELFNVTQEMFLHDHKNCI